VAGVARQEALGFGAYQEGVDFFLELLVGPDAGGGLEDFDGFATVGLEQIETADP
jgi:hypothetical protein